MILWGRPASPVRPRWRDSLAAAFDAGIVSRGGVLGRQEICEAIQHARLRVPEGTTILFIDEVVIASTNRSKTHFCHLSNRGCFVGATTENPPSSSMPRCCPRLSAVLPKPSRQTQISPGAARESKGKALSRTGIQR